MGRQQDFIKLFIEKLPKRLDNGKIEQIIAKLEPMHVADIAEVISNVPEEYAVALIRLLSEDVRSDVVAEIGPEERGKLLELLPAVEIAESVVNKMDSDDAADLIAELPLEKQSNVIKAIKDTERASDISDLLTYADDTAGGLMAKELVKVKDHWNVSECVVELRKQAEEIEEVHTVYVVDEYEKLIGITSLKKLILSSPQTIIDVYIPKVDFVTVTTEDEEVARIMQKYDLEAIPVVDENGILVGRITIDDIVDFIKEEAEKDYQMAAGISQDVEADDSILELTKARLPLAIGWNDWWDFRSKSNWDF